MGVPHKYWRWVRLNAAGTCSVEELAPAKAFMQQFLSPTAEMSDALIQRQLMQLLISESAETRQQAEQCLRCFISNQTEQVCIELEQKFGKQGDFTRHDLFPLVLNDVDRRISLTSGETDSAYQPLAAKILQNFDPERSLLSTWTKRTVLYDKQLNAFLEERGIRLTSDWAILNGKRPGSLARLLGNRLTPEEIQRQAMLLESFHAIYRRDRLQQGQVNGQVKSQAGRRCPPPTSEQLQQMVQFLQGKGIRSLTPVSLMQELRALAGLLRPTHRMTAESIDEQGADQFQTPEPDEPDTFLQRYFQEFLSCLDWSIELTTRDRLTYLRQKKPPKDNAFFTALKLFYCQLRSMGEIAPLVGLQQQYQVARLLKLKELREDVRRGTITQMRQQERLKERIGEYLNLSRLAKLDAQLDAALNQVIADAAAEASSPNRTNRSLFAQRLCQCLDNWRTS
ncbi:hypothetical protein [Leptolyngbya ohadii]|uniref:hypothetical protein n=1 Tax=Leptolyngbya ohadii TaxID=1962290 RepID=UPI000B59AAA6|nr:hypothetical protein [Leptolyngbya ohadii]